jgi:hypothetical protein
MEAADVELASEDVLNEPFLQRMRHQAGDALKRAISKVLGLLDAQAKLIFIDQSVPPSKQTFLKLHEIGHAALPWQKTMYSVIEDCKQTIAPDISDHFDREANAFASEVLFQRDTFTKEAADFDFGIKVPINLSKKYGSSVYSAVRRYVSTNHRSCVVLIVNPPEFTNGSGFVAILRRVVASKSFEQQFGSLAWTEQLTPDDQFGAIIPLNGRRMSGKRNCVLKDIDGIEHECVAEAFTNTYQVFILIYPMRALTRTLIALSG